MDSPFALSRRNALDTVTAGLVDEPTRSLAPNPEADDVEAARGRHLRQAVTLSAFGQAQTLVCGSKLSDEKLGVVTTFGGADFEIDGRHDHFLS